ncbi:dihydrofolate reductase family protein [Candidatus Uhrbacteria bacterium]|nr:dihydrofolate reductase family protein [Candidatus Uhrbacteria bacterium]
MNAPVIPQRRGRQSPVRPRFTAFAAMSADGKISLRKASLPSWTSREDQRFFQKSLAGFDAVVVGRNTYETAARSLRRRTTYVITSRTSKKRRYGSVTFVNPAGVDLAALFSQYRSVAVLGGSSVYGLMARHGLLHDFYLTIEPLLFGRGTPLIAGLKRTLPLRLASIRRLNRTGTILLHYLCASLP